MKILDLTAGNRAVWFDKNYRDAIYVDCRPEVDPTFVLDSRSLPHDWADFGLIVFDPPHVNGGKNGNISRDYGHHTSAEIRDIVSRGAREAHRVSRTDALMAFKWNDHDQPLPKILDLMAPWWEPLFGHKTASRTKHSSSTQWVMLRRINDKNEIKDALRQALRQWAMYAENEGRDLDTEDTTEALVYRQSLLLINAR